MIKEEIKAAQRQGEQRDRKHYPIVTLLGQPRRDQTIAEEAGQERGRDIARMIEGLAAAELMRAASLLDQTERYCCDRWRNE